MPKIKPPKPPGMLEYRGHKGSVEYSAYDDCLYGKIQGVRGLIAYSGTSVAEITASFRRAVDDLIDNPP